jgi:glycosyltransferase involved in cell wall biosynthesis
MFLLPNPVDGDEVRRLAKGAASNGGRFSLCAVGRLSPEKGYDVLISALAHARDRLGDWELTVIGEGKLHESLVRQALDAGLQNRITFLGRMANPYPTLASADVLVHPARWDGCPLVLCEALSLGIPVIATHAPGGTRETLADGRFGLLVPPEEPEALAAALVRFASSPTLRSNYAAAGPARAASFSPEQIARRILVRLESSEASA